MLYEKMLTAVEETSTFGLEWGALHLNTMKDDDQGRARSKRWIPLLFINRFRFRTEAETSGTTKLHRGNVSFVLHLHVIGTCAVTHAFTLPWGENWGPHTAFGSRPAPLGDADLFHHFSLRTSNSLPSPTVELAFFDATLDGPRRSFCPTIALAKPSLTRSPPPPPRGLLRGLHHRKEAVGQFYSKRWHIR